MGYSKTTMNKKNKKLLADFLEYLVANPDQRFWQALRNWSGAEKINFETKGYQIDTFYWNEKDK